MNSLPNNKNTFYAKKKKQSGSGKRKFPTTLRSKLRPQNKGNRVQRLDQALNRMKLNSPKTYYHSMDSKYIEALLAPECSHNAKIPGSAAPSVSIKRHVTLNFNANATGSLGLVWQPTYVTDTTNLGCTFVVYNDVNYNGVTTTGTGAAKYANQSITPGSIAQYRVVSASMHITPQSSVLNLAGSIHAGYSNVAACTGVIVDAAVAAFNPCALIPNFQQGKYYREASISQMEGIRLVTVPTDDCFIDYVAINKSSFSNDPDVLPLTLSAVVQGAAASAPFRVDLFWNIEAIPAPGSILCGMESICIENTPATSVWRDIYMRHQGDLIVASKALSNVANVSIAKAKQSAIAYGPRGRPPMDMIV